LNDGKFACCGSGFASVGQHAFGALKVVTCRMKTAALRTFWSAKHPGKGSLIDEVKTMSETKPTLIRATETARRLGSAA